MNIHDPVRTLVALIGFSAALACSAQQPEPLAHPNLDLRAAGSIRAMVRDSRGGTIIGGQFESIDGVPRRNLARLRPDGALDPEWTVQIDAAEGMVGALTADTDGSVFVGGSFLAIGGHQRARLAKIRADGSIDPLWNPGASDSVWAIALGGNGSLYVGGKFQSIGGVQRSALAKLSASGTGTVDSNWSTRLTQLSAMTIAPGGGLYVIGNLQADDGSPRTLVKLSAASGVWDSTWHPIVYGYAYTIALDRAGSLLVGGNFVGVNGQSGPSVARIAPGGSGEVDPRWKPVVYGEILAILADGAGHVYLAGRMLEVGGLPRYGLARVAEDGTGAVDPDWNPGVADIHGSHRVLLAREGGGIEVGGYFRRIAGHPRLSYASIDALGSVDETVDVEVPSQPRVIASQSDGSIIVGGSFQKYGDAYRATILRLTPDGLLDPHWAPDRRRSPCADGRRQRTRHHWGRIPQRRSAASALSCQDFHKSWCGSRLRVESFSCSRFPHSVAGGYPR